MADKNTVKDLLTDEIKDLYSAEKQLTKAIPKMAKGSTDSTLKEAFTAHLKETQRQVVRLEEIAKLLEIKPTGKKCVGMEGCISEGAEALEEEGEDSILDLGLIGAGTRVEHPHPVEQPAQCVTAPRDADETVRAYFASTPRRTRPGKEKPACSRNDRRQSRRRVHLRIRRSLAW